MRPLEDIVSTLPEHERLLGLAGLSFFSGMGILPTTTDIVLIVAGILVQRELFSFTESVLVCLVSTILAEMIVFEIGHRLGKKFLRSNLVQKVVKEDKILQLEEKLSGSHSTVARMIRFTPALRPWILLGLSSLGLNRKDYYRVAFLLLVPYVPFLIYLAKVLSSHIHIRPEWALYLLIVFSAVNFLTKKKKGKMPLESTVLK